MDERQLSINRRRFIECSSAAGLGSALLPGALAAVAQDAGTITIDMLQSAQRIAGVSFTPDEQRRLLEKLNGGQGYLAGFARLRAASLGNSTQPALVFNPVLPGKKLLVERRPVQRQTIDVTRPASDEDLAFLPVTHLARLVESRQVTPTELAKLCLARLKKHDPQLHCVVTLTEDLALRQAMRADEEIASGAYRGPLHGIPWGLKDLFAVRGIRTTWGMSPFKDRVIETDATVYSQLTQAGAILVAKLSTEDYPAIDQEWCQRPASHVRTRQPSRRHDAGVDAGHRRPNVPLGGGLRVGVGRDLRARRKGQHDRRRAVQRGRLRRRDGIARGLHVAGDRWGDRRSDSPQRRERIAGHPFAGVTLVPFALPDVPLEAIDFIRHAETAAAFDDVMRAGLLTETERGPEQSRRPDEIRSAYFIPAVEFIQANRLRMRVMEKVDEALGDLDMFIGSRQALTNRTGHSVVSVPNGFSNGSPTALHLTGKLFGEQGILRLAHAFQAKTDFHLQHPKL